VTLLLLALFLGSHDLVLQLAEKAMFLWLRSVGGCISSPVRRRRNRRSWGCAVLGLLLRSRLLFLARFRMFFEILLVLERVHPDRPRRIRLRIDVKSMATVTVDLADPAVG
jgi:hypothetical protein